MQTCKHPAKQNTQKCGEKKIRGIKLKKNQSWRTRVTLKGFHETSRIIFLKYHSSLIVGMYNSGEWVALKILLIGLQKENSYHQTH
jgi:hypothetical protein